MSRKLFSKRVRPV